MASRAWQGLLRREVGLWFEVGGVVGTAHERAAGDVAEAFLFSDLFEELEAVGVDVFHHGQVLFRGAQILAERDDGHAGFAEVMMSLWTTINALPSGPLFTPPLIASYLPVGTSTPQPLTLSEAGTRLAGLKTSIQDILNAENGLQAMRPYRDGLWENEIRPLLVAYQKKVEGDFPPEQAESSSVIGTIPAGGLPQFSSDAGFLVPGQTASVKIFVVLSTGNERGSNTVSLTRP